MDTKMYPVVCLVEVFWNIVLKQTVQEYVGTGWTEFIWEALDICYLTRNLKYGIRSSGSYFVHYLLTQFVRKGFVEIPSLTHSLTRSITHSLTHSLNHSLPHSITHSLYHSLTLSLTPSLNHSLTLLLTPSLHSLNNSLTQSLTHSLNHSPTQ